MHDSSTQPPLPQVAVNIRTARRAAGLSQEGLARQVGVSTSTVRNWERDCRLPEGKNLVALCRVLDRHASWFFTEPEQAKDRAA